MFDFHEDQLYFGSLFPTKSPIGSYFPWGFRTGRHGPPRAATSRRFEVVRRHDLSGLMQRLEEAKIIQQAHQMDDAVVVLEGLLGL